MDAQKRLETFKATWRNEATQELFERARQSLQANSDLSAAATVPMYGWTETDLMDSEKADDASSARALEHGIVEDGVHFDQVDVARVVDDFRKAHPNFNVDLEVWRKENWVINVCVLSHCQAVILLTSADTISSTEDLLEVQH